jgi:hypothetical protein
MSRFWKVLVLLQLHVAFCTAQGVRTEFASAQEGAALSSGAPQIAAWTALKVQHAYGLPEAKPKEKGTLTVNSQGLTFTGKSSRYTMPWREITAVSTGSEKVEMWGTTGRIVRMAIPDGGGLAAASVMHHKVNQLTVEFHDPGVAYHGAVFYLPANDAARVLNAYSQLPAKPIDAARDLPAVHAEQEAVACRQPLPGVLVAAPDWNHADVPAAYRALVYEHIVDRLQRVQGAVHVYREGELDQQHACPQYTISISIMNFKPGSQVERATMGPVGFFVGKTQMTFSATITDATGQLHVTEQLHAAVRGESESKNVADGVAKSLAKRYSATLKQFESTRAGTGPAYSRLR